MPVTIVADASCIILLEKMAMLHMLQRLFGNILITDVVATEVGHSLPEWIIITAIKDVEQQAILSTIVDKGEASAIALALSKQPALLIIDDFKGRKLARRLGLNITGTLGVLVQAKNRGYISSLRLTMEKVQQTDFRLSPMLIQEILEQAGE